MKKLVLLFITCLLSLTARARPYLVTVEGQSHHVQGIAYDEAASRMYFSFTTRFIVTDDKSQIIGSIDEIHGHLGAMTFDAAQRKVYASLECKDDEIGANISKKMGVDAYKESSFYIVEIDVDAVNRLGVSQEEAMRRISVPQANEDYKAEVTVGGQVFQHRYGCTGIDGITIGPDFGGKGGEFLYVAYGVKSDTLRTDNDYQVLLQYKMSDIRKGDSSSPRRFFVKTGNTSYGVQNLAYDAFSGLMYMAVYKGKKKNYPNYDLFAVDMAARPVKAKLDGVPYEKGSVMTVPLARRGWRFNLGATGMCSLGNGYWYFAEPGKTKDPETGKSLNKGTVKLYYWICSDTPFKKVGVNPEYGPFAQDWTKGPAWLENAVIYQIYPSSYKDSDGNGIGDLKGICSQLDYIASLGVKCVWLNPIFVSDFIDGGYDVVDFYKVDPRFGTNNDLVELVNDAHKRGLKLMLDLVAGHSSVKCEWFRQSCEGTNLRYSDYFIWTDRLPDEKAERELAEMLKDPNYMQNTIGNWMKSDEPRGKYYMKNFYACQPALNYGYAHPDPNLPWQQGVNDEGPKAVRAELMNIMAFWFGKGVDGFRVDMAASLVKKDSGRKETIKFWRKIRKWMDENYPDRALVAEWGNPQECLSAGFNVDMDLSHLTTVARNMYFTNHNQADGGSYFSLNGAKPSEKDLFGTPWPEEKIDRSITPERILKNYYWNFTHAVDDTKDWGWYASITGNHDQLRMNIGGRNTPEQLKVMMTWVLCMPLPILYYGDEIGMRSLVGLPNVEGADSNGMQRSGARTPMQWTGGPTAGFSTCESEQLYLPVCPYWTPASNYKDYLEWVAKGCKNPVAKGAPTVESQSNDPQSLLNWTRSLIALRNANKAFGANSAFEPVYIEGAYPMVFKRSDGDNTFAVVLNPTGKTQKVALNAFVPDGKKAETVLSAGQARQSAGQLVLKPCSAVILRIQ